MTNKRTEFPDRKQEQISVYKQLFSEAKAAYLLNFNGSTVEQLTNFRKDLSAVGSKLKVVQNRLTKLALADSIYAKFNDKLTKDNIFVLANEDAYSTAKILAKHVADVETLKLVSGLIGEQKEKLLNSADIIKISKLPGRNELLAQLLGALNGTTVKFVRTLNEPIAGFARALQAYAQTKA